MSAKAKRGIRKIFTLRRRLLALMLGSIPLLVTGFFTGSAVGLLMLATALYFASFAVFGVQPSFAAIGQMFSALSAESKLAVIGLFAAYFGAMLTWKRQKVVELRLEAGNEIHEFFQGAAKSSLVLSTFAGSLLSAHRAAKRGRLQDELWRIVVLRNSLDKALDARVDLAERGTGVYGMVSKHGMLVGSSMLAQYSMPKAAAHVSKLSVYCHFFIPSLDGEIEDVVHRLALMNARAARKYQRQFKESHGRMLLHSGGVYGAFQQAIITPSLALILYQVKQAWMLYRMRDSDL